MPTNPGLTQFMPPRRHFPPHSPETTNSCSLESEDGCGTTTPIPPESTLPSETTDITSSPSLSDSLTFTPNSSFPSIPASTSLYQVQSTSTSYSVTSTSSIVSQTASSSIARSRTNTSAIAGGVIGGLLAVLLLLGLIFLWFRRRRRNRVAPSSEFLAARATPGLPDTPHAQIPLARHASIEDEQPPPPFTRGSYRDPVYEKVRAARVQRQQYGLYDQDGMGPATSWERDQKSEKSFLIE
ncbi:uncharacterized protein LAESUDRAFT_720659 [Laetiporus sulphureus 93-53]|uniref:receptor protein-tyrosine kinase n=1 Tax=Laetiporus sulphureus 93-53 TaxID=1314785 RepID=A0A165H9I8_9APHY|nr:uncharacterized protein LAESUDRAFT_720659 [Laetiporus sulphureus 93-53]KZT11429.1 hypothetical protein LAESUDRAFT_720659 [Laetiporus sulphureus 93-53]